MFRDAPNAVTRDDNQILIKSLCEYFYYRSFVFRLTRCLLTAILTDTI